MKIEENTANNILHIKNGGGLFLFIFGLFFMLPGLFIILLTLQVIHVKGDVPPLFFGLPFGGIFFTVGSAISLGRNGIFINMNNNTLISWWGLLVAFKKKSFDISSLKEVAITKEIRRSKNSSYTVYPVRIHPFDIKISEPRNYLESRRAAEKVASFIRKPLHDRSQGNLIVRDWDKLDESVRERIRRRGEKIPETNLPADSAIRINEGHTQMQIDIPAKGTNVEAVIKLAASVIPLFFLIPFLSVFSMAGRQNLIFMIFPLVFFLIIFAAFLPKIIQSLKSIKAVPLSIKVSAREIIIEKGKETTTIKVDDIEEVDIKHSFFNNEILLLTDEKIYSFGYKLSEEELNHLKNKILLKISQ